MAFVHGKASKVYVNGVDLTTFLSKATNAKTIDKAETSCFGTTFKSYVPGQTDASLQMEGYFDGSALAIDAQLQALLALDPALFTLLSAGDAASNTADGFLGFQSEYSILTDITAAVKVSMSAQSKVGAVPLIVGQPKTAFATIATTDTATYDTQAALSLLGGEMHYHIFNLSGTGSPGVRVRWQTSPNGSVWTTIADSGVISAAGVPSYGRVTVAAGVTMDVQSRIEVVTTGSTIATSVFAATHRN